MRNKLFTSTIDKLLFKQYKLGSDLSKQKVVAKIFNPYGEGRWFLLNSDPDDPDYLWAIVSMHGNVEIGSVSRNELMNLRLTKYGLPLERDLYFSPKNAKEVYEGLLEGKHFAKGGIVGLSVSGYTIKGRKGNYYIHDVQGRLVEKTYETLDEVKKAFDRLVVMRAHQKHESKSMSETLADVDRFYAKGGKLQKLTKTQKEFYERVTNTINNNTYSKSITTYNLPKDTRQMLEELYYMGYLNRKYIQGTQEAEYTLKFAKGGMTSGSDDMYVSQLANMSGTRAVAVKGWIASNNLSDDDVLNIIQGLGRKQIATREFIDAVLGDKKATMMVVDYAKSGKGIKMAQGGELTIDDYEEKTHLDAEDFARIEQKVEDKFRSKITKSQLHEKFTKEWYNGGRERAIAKYGDDEEEGWSNAWDDYVDAYLKEGDFERIEQKVEDKFRSKSAKSGLHEKFTKEWYNGGRERAIAKYGDDEEEAWSNAWDDYVDAYLKEGDFARIEQKVEDKFRSKSAKSGLHEKFTKEWYNGGRERAIAKYGDDEQEAWSNAWGDYLDANLKMAKGGKVDSLKSKILEYDKYKFGGRKGLGNKNPMKFSPSELKNKSERIRAIYGDFQKDGYSKEDINLALDELNYSKYAKGGGVGSWESLTIEKMQKDFPFSLDKLNKILRDVCMDRDDAVVRNFQLSWQSKKYDTFANLVFEAEIYLKETGSDSVSPSGTYHSQKGLSINIYLRQRYDSDGSGNITINASKNVAGGMVIYNSEIVNNYSEISNYISLILKKNPKNNLDNFVYAKGGEVGNKTIHFADLQGESLPSGIIRYYHKGDDDDVRRKIIDFAKKFNVKISGYEYPNDNDNIEFYAKGKESDLKSFYKEFFDIKENIDDYILNYERVYGIPFFEEDYDEYAKGGEVAEYWEKITEETINARFPYEYLDYFNDLFSGDIWLKFSKQPTTREFNLPYEVKRAINEDFEYYSYGEGTPMKKVSLMDGSWGSFYIHFENLPYSDIMYLLKRLPNEVQERLELKGIKGYGELGFDTYGQTFNVTLTNPDSEEVESGGKGKNVILSFSFNTDNISLDDVTEIVENYTKDWRTGGDIFEPNFYVNLRESEANELKDELESYGYFNDIEIEDSRYQYADGGELDLKKKVRFDEGGETSDQHYEPTYLMTLDEYIKLGIPTTIKNYEKFIKKNGKYLARAGYSGLDYWTLEDALESSKSPFERFSDYDWIRNIEELGGATRIDYARAKHFDNWSDTKYTQDPTPIDIRVENQVFREKLSKYFPHRTHKYKEKTWTTSGMQRIENEFKKTNKAAIRDAMQNGVYKELLNTGRISIDRLKEITDSVGVRITKDTLSGDKKVEFMEGLKKTLSGLPQKSFDKVKEFAEDFHKELKEISDIVYEREYERLSDVILSFVGKRIEMSRVSMAIPISLFSIYDYTSEEIEGKTKYYYDRITMVDIKALQPNWEKYLKDYVKYYVEKLKWNIVSVMADVFRKVTIPIKSYQKISLERGVNGFEGSYKFNFEDGSSFVVNTQGVGAGGYNIQVFHYRYLTNITNATLPSGEVTKDLSHWEKRFAKGGEIENDTPETIIDLYNYLKPISPEKISINKVVGTNEYRIKVWDYGFFTYPFKNESLTNHLRKKYPSLSIETERRFGNPYNQPKTSSILVSEKK